MIIGEEQAFHVAILTIGAIIKRIMVPDYKGTYSNVVLDYDTLEDYLSNPAYIGATIGRTAGRTANAMLNMGNKLIVLDSCNAPNALHGGSAGFHKINWQVASHNENKLTLEMVDNWQSGKTPGNIKLKAQFEIVDGMSLKVTYNATTDDITYLNLTNHSYFNLSGKDISINEHKLTIASNVYAPLNSAMLPIEPVSSVKCTPFDFTTPKYIGDILRENHEQLILAKGIDHPFLLNSNENIVKLYDSISKRQMSISTNQSCIVVYSGNYLDEANVPSNKTFKAHQGICFEAQDIPNACNRKDTVVNYLEPGKQYFHQTTYTFDVDMN